MCTDLLAARYRGCTVSGCLKDGDDHWIFYLFWSLEFMLKLKSKISHKVTADRSISAFSVRYSRIQRATAV